MPSSLVTKRISYPERDGKPMGETDVHVREITSVFSMLDSYFSDDPDINVGANMLCYYLEGDPSKCFCPDVFVVLGVPKKSRRTYKMWEELKPPTVIIEVSSRKTRREDLHDKKLLYASLRVQEYFIYDPLHEYLRPPLQGFRLKGADYVPLSAKPDGSLVSQRLGLRLNLLERELAIWDDATGERLLRYQEQAQRRREAEAENERLRQEVERLRKKNGR